MVREEFYGVTGPPTHPPAQFVTGNRTIEITTAKPDWVL